MCFYVFYCPYINISKLAVQSTVLVTAMQLDFLGILDDPVSR